MASRNGSNGTNGTNGTNGIHHHRNTDRASLITSFRDIVAVGFRHKRLMIYSFLGTSIVAALVLLWWNPYQPELDILLHHQRMDPVVTTQATSLGGFSQDNVAPEEQNSEVQMLLSEDLLHQVAIDSGLYKTIHVWPWSSAAMQVPKATRLLQKSLVITPLTKSNIITVTYSSRDPKLAYAVLDSLSKRYLEKNLAVHRPHGAGEFFEGQTAEYWKKLSDAESKLISFGRTEGVAGPQLDRDNALQKVNDLEFSLGQTKANIAQTEEHITALKAQLASTKPRYETQVHTAENSGLMAQLKSSLSTLELKRTDLLTRYAPTYPLVQEVETQIAQTHAAIEAEQKAPGLDSTTDVNPTHLMLTQELAKAESDLPALRVQAEAIAKVIRNYRERIVALDGKAVQQNDLLRDVKSAESSYLLYLGKRDEERIQNVLDEKKIVDVTIQAPPVLPQLPYYSRLLLIALSFLLGTFVSVSAGLTAEYLDSSFRTPDEVRTFLDVPVLAAVPAERN
jgi:uncharacterized protein involved in exopolysaccharide biosynthesis